MSIMEDFLGTWKLERSENFEEYLTARNVPWMIRKMIQAATVTKVISRNAADDTYTYVNQYPIKTVTLTFKFNETVDSVGLDNKKRKITFEFKDGAFYETHVIAEGDDQAPEVYKYIREGDYMVVVLEHNGVVGKRYYKKLP